MAEVITFRDYTPPARYDNLPWVRVRIEESATETGTYIALETLNLSPIDADPSKPAARSFTTERGTALDYWYRVVFIDGTGDTSQPTTPIQNVTGGVTPDVLAYATTTELARILRLRQPTPAQEVAMQRVLDTAALEIDRELGRITPFSPAPALVVEVNLERAVEHWQQQESPFGVIGLGESAPTVTASDSWNRHANKLAPLKETWGFA